MEFALVAPVLIGLAIGMVETVRYIRARAAAFLTASTIADVVASQTSVTPGTGGTLRDACIGAGYTILPLGTTTLTAAVASYTFPNGSNPFQKDWESDTACTATGAPTTSAMSSTAASLTPNRGDSIIMVRTTYTYVPMVSTVFPSYTFQQIAFARPRFGAVLCPTC